MLRLDTDIMATTVPDLQNYHVKRSAAREDIEYIYIPHGVVSSTMLVREKAYDYYDTFFCNGPGIITELRKREETARLKRKSLVKTGCGLYDDLAEAYAAMPKTPNKKPQILIAPSWQADNIMELCIDDMLNALLGHGYEIILRPHPQFIRLFPERIKTLHEEYAQYIQTGEIMFELDFASNESIYMSDILISDWSGILVEFSFCTLKPCICINTPMKVMNPSYHQYGIESPYITVRGKIGVSVNVENVKDINEITRKLLFEKDSYKVQIQQCIEQYLFYPCRNGEAGGKYIKNRLEERNFKN